MALPPATVSSINCMSNTNFRRWFGILTLGFFVWSADLRVARATDAQLATLQIGTVTYSNVTVYGQTEKDLYISHAGGLQNIKMSELDPAALRALGLLEAAEEAEVAATAPKPNWLDKFKAWVANFKEKSAAAATTSHPLTLRPTPQLVTGILVGSLMIYLFFCFCLKCICQNAGTDPGVLIWLPILQMIPLLRAAQMSPWWLLAMFIPVINLLVQIWWTFRLVKACHKGVLTAIFLLLPITNFFAFLYLAFSKPDADAVAPRGPRFEGLPA